MKMGAKVGQMEGKMQCWWIESLRKEDLTVFQRAFIASQ